MRISDKNKNSYSYGYTKKQHNQDNCLNFIKKSSFVTSYDRTPEDLSLAQFAFCGRSNVGKSSLINAILNRKLAFTSKSPGKTILINVFLINENFYIVDLPGYGYAKRSKELRNKWKNSIEGYLLKSTLLLCVFVLIDSRHPAQDSDLMFIEWLKANNKEFSIIFTKADKSKQKDISDNIKYLKSRFGEFNFFITSSKKKKGTDKLCGFIEKRLNNMPYQNL